MTNDPATKQRHDDVKLRINGLVEESVDVCHMCSFLFQTPIMEVEVENNLPGRVPEILLPGLWESISLSFDVHFISFYGTLRLSI